MAGKMGNWNAKNLYLNLKSVYMNYTAGDNQESKGGYDKSYINFKLFYDRCNDFVAITNSTKYPADKYKEIEEIQAYFKSKVGEYAYQKDRRPQDAIDFLNDCAKKFAVHKLYFDTYQYSDFNFDPERIFFQMKGPTLEVISSSFESGTAIDDAKIRVDLLNLSKITSAELRTSDAGRSSFLFLYGQTNYDNGGREVQDFWMMAKKRAYIGAKKARKKDAERYENNKNEMMAISNGSKEISTVFSALKSGNKFIDFFLFFNTNNDQFRNGNYAERIREAVQFLIDYFPKKKEEMAGQTKSKF
uniref:hypothetical protein n=1 Tax=Pedobacter schmidteae TaxID=2201271 RepID=UPI0013CEE285|nr:hypothetical protein [Pedobacter schmidteae]